MLVIEKALAVLLLLCLLPLCAFAGDAITTKDGSFPELNAEGFLDEGEFLFEDPENGVWRYCSATLKVEIYRRTQEKPKQIWYEAEVWARDGELFHMVADNPEKRMKSQDYPYKICRANKAVLAVNNDYAQLRINQKSKVGIIIRDGEIYSDKTFARNRSKFPNLDTLAMFPDGSWKTYYSDEYTAQEYLDMGATDVLAFGPWLIRDGVLNEDGLNKYGKSKEPRTAIGMIEPNHYMLMMLEGRHKGSNGGSVRDLAEKLYEKGCTEALNLDGGQTSCIVFMGKQICTVGKNSGSASGKLSARKTSDVVAIGTSELVHTDGAMSD